MCCLPDPKFIFMTLTESRRVFVLPQVLKYRSVSKPIKTKAACGAAAEGQSNIPITYLVVNVKQIIGTYLR